VKYWIYQNHHVVPRTQAAQPDSTWHVLIPTDCSSRGLVAAAAESTVEFY
jgi:hypothetical protein